jgi:predicted AAA+ superfamily ATPase
MHNNEQRKPKHPKIYFYDVGFRNAMLGLLDVSLSSDEYGHIAEIVLHDHLRRLAYKLNEGGPVNLSFYQGKGGREVDFILDLPRFSLKLPIELKYRKSISSKQLEGLHEYASLKKPSRKPPFSIVVTMDKLDLDNGILFVPMWMFLLLC